MIKDGMENMTDSEIADIKTITEIQAYNNQNKFLSTHGLQTLNVQDRVAWSTSAGECGNETKMAGKID